MKTDERSAFDDATDEMILRLYSSYEREQNMSYHEKNGWEKNVTVTIASAPRKA